MQIAKELIDGIDPDLLKKLGEMKPPRYAYVMVQKPKSTAFKKDGVWKYENRFRVKIFNLEQQPGQLEKIKHELDVAGSKLVDWGNFPKVNDPKPENQLRCRVHMDQYGRTPWDDVDQYLHNVVKGIINNPQAKKMAAEVERQIEENLRLKAELEEAKRAKK